jgi:hypothetical protein
MSRREQIEAMLVDEPHDTFLNYALAMELNKAGEHEAGLAKLAALQEFNPPYIPAFFMAGQQLARLQRYAEAREVIRRGITAADTAGDLHAAGEMRQFLTELGQFGE